MTTIKTQSYVSGADVTMTMTATKELNSLYFNLAFRNNLKYYSFLENYPFVEIDYETMNKNDDEKYLRLIFKTTKSKETLSIVNTGNSGTKCVRLFSIANKNKSITKTISNNLMIKLNSLLQNQSSLVWRVVKIKANVMYLSIETSSYNVFINDPLKKPMNDLIENDMMLKEKVLIDTFIV